MARGIYDILTDQRTLDWGNKILNLEPDSAPFLVVSKKLGTEKADNQKFISFEDRPYLRWFYVGTVTGAPGSLTGLKLEVVENDTAYAAAAAYIQINDLLYDPLHDHTMLVTNVDYDTGEITATREYAGQGEGAALYDGRTADLTDVTSDAHTDPLDGNRIVKVSNTYPDGGVSAVARALAMTEIFNFIQKFQLAYDVDEETMLAELKGGPELKRLQARKAIEHLKDIELQLILGDRDARYVTVNGQRKMRYTTGGLLHSGITVQSIATDDFNEDAWNSFLRLCFAVEGSKEKLMLCGGQIIEANNKWAQGRVVINNKLSAVMGMTVPAYQTTFGRLNLIYHPLLKNSFEGYGIVLDMNYLKLKVYGPATQLQTGLQANDAQERKDQYLSRFGLKLGLREVHRILKVT